MKKSINRLWVGIVAFFAVLIGACCTHKPTEDPEKMTRKQMKERIAEIRAIVQEREQSCVYGSPEIIQRYGQETARLRHEADSLEQELNKTRR